MTVVSLDRLRSDDLRRQAAHWLAASVTFADAEGFASSQSWQSLENDIGLPIRRRLGETVSELVAMGKRTTELATRSALDPGLLPEATAAVQELRRRYSQVEVTLGFFESAVNSRTSPSLRTALSNLDRLAELSIRPVLEQAGAPIPPVLTYLDKGMGASILRVGVRLWAPGAINPVAAIRMVHFSLAISTSLFHEAGHQVAFLTGWTPSVKRSIATALAGDADLARMWTAWSSEIAADVFAFLHTGYASVAALYDVVGDDRTILAWPVGDPHPIGYLRTRLGCAFCRARFGPGPWDQLERAMMANHPVATADPSVAALIFRSERYLPALAEACLSAPVPKLGGRPMSSVVDPARVSPRALAELERTTGPALWSSPHFRRVEGIRIVALAGLRAAEDPGRSLEWMGRARGWITGIPLAA